MLIEVIVTNVKEAKLAEQYGADRLELIHAFESGGLSPALNLSKEVCLAVNIPVNVMVRPHSQGFVYADKTMQFIFAEIDYVAEYTKANAIVFGSLTSKGNINLKQLESVIKRLEHTRLGLTFHRAIDVSNDVIKSFIELQNYKTSISHVLTSGGKDTALAGADYISQMQHIAGKNGVKVLAGSGINPGNAHEIIAKTRVNEIHFGTGLRKATGELDPDLFDKLKISISQ